MTVAAETKSPDVPRTWPDRVLAALPLATVFTLFALLYAAESWAHKAPWIFFDELYYARLSRQIAGLGEGPGGPFSFEGLYPFWIAPAWLIEDTHTAYATAKYIGALTMTAACVPAYLLARALVSRPLALFVSAATVAVPAMFYTSTLMQETLAYPYAILCFFLIVRALTTPSPAWVGGAVAASAVAPLVRTELLVIPAAFALAAAGFAVTGERARRRWSGSSVWLKAGAAAGVIAAAALFGALALPVSSTWSAAIRHPVAMIEYARSGAASLTIGLGILPAIAGMAALIRPRGAQRLAPARAFAALFAAAAAGFLLSTAAKGVGLGGGANAIEERNLIYLAPLLLTGTALWL